MGAEHIEVEVNGHVGWLWLNRPEKKNAMSRDMWEDIPAAMADLDADDTVRVVVVAGRGDSFTVGIDLEMLASLDRSGTSAAERNLAFYREVTELQRTMSVFADSAKPVIAAVHGWCLGAGIDLITACDIRLASEDATFSIRETRMGLVADVGTLQRLPKVIAPGHVAELLFTGKDIDASEAERIGLVNRVHADRESLFDAAKTMAEGIATNSPLVVQGAKRVLAAGEEMTTAQALDHVALWNTAFIDSNDLREAMTSFMQKRPPNYTGT